MRGENLINRICFCVSFLNRYFASWYATRILRSNNFCLVEWIVQVTIYGIDQVSVYARAYIWLIHILALTLLPVFRFFSLQFAVCISDAFEKSSHVWLIWGLVSELIKYVHILMTLWYPGFDRILCNKYHYRKFHFVCVCVPEWIYDRPASTS